MKTAILLLSLILTFVLSKVCEAQDWRTNLPPDWLGVAIVHDLPEFDRQADRMAKLFGMEAPQLVRLLESSGLTDVTDVKRSWIAGLARNSEGKEGTYPFAFVPVTDFKAFVDAYDGDINGKTAIVTIEQQDLLAGNCGRWTLLMSLDRSELLESIVDRVPGELPEDENEVEAIGIATFNLSGTGLKWLAEYKPAGEQPSREQAIARRKRGLAMLCPDGIRESLTLDKPLWEWMASTFTDAKLSVRFDAEGGANLLVVAATQKSPERLARVAHQQEFDLFDEYQWISMGRLHTSPELVFLVTGWQIAQLKSAPEELGIEKYAEAEIVELERSVAKLIGQVSVVDFASLASEALPIYGNRVVCIGVSSNEDFFDSCDELMNRWNALIAASTAEVELTFSAEQVEIAGATGRRYFVDMVEAVDVPRSREVGKVMAEMFGPNGFLQWFVLPMGKNRMYVANLPREEVEKLVGELKDEVANPQSKSGTTSFRFDASAYVDWCKRRDRAMQGEVIGGPRFVPMPKSRPLDASVTVSEGRLKIELDLPPSLLQTLGKYSQELRQQ